MSVGAGPLVTTPQKSGDDAGAMARHAAIAAVILVAVTTALLRPLSQPSPAIAHAQVYTVGTHVPVPLHVPPVHAVPLAALPVTEHTGAPLVQIVVPVVHGLPVEHAAPGTHATQAPAPLQTPPAHAVPAAELPLAVQTGAPLVHTMEPVRHAIGGVQAIPLVHALHTPAALHTPPAHAVPAAALPFAVHTGVPVVHEMAPVRHAAVGVHDVPPVQTEHAPLPLQTPPPQAVPAGALPVTLHTGAPVLQASVPVVHALPVEHVEPATHGTQTPLPLHTPPVHAVPAAALLLAVHTGAPVVQESMPVEHALPVEQAEPATQGTHAPWPSQTPPVHAAPAATLPAAAHVGVVPLQLVTPVVQALPVEQLALASHAGPVSGGNAAASMPTSGVDAAASTPPSMRTDPLSAWLPGLESEPAQPPTRASAAERAPNRILQQLCSLRRLMVLRFGR